MIALLYLKIERMLIVTRGGKREGAGRPLGQGKFKEKTKPLRIPESKVLQVLNFIHGKNKAMKLPLYSCYVAAGFPSPADDHIQKNLDLNEHLIHKPAATFFVRAQGNSMTKAGIHEGDILIVDRSLTPIHGKIVIAAVDGMLTVKRIIFKGKETWLYPENDEFKPILLEEYQDVTIWGVVTNVIHKV